MKENRFFDGTKTRVFLFGMPVVILAFDSVLVGCKTDSDDDDGGGGGKPVLLAEDATLADARAKIDEIHNYSGTPEQLKPSVTQIKRSLERWDDDTWSSGKAGMISSINQINWLSN
jgi:hypothetical protein